MHFGNNIEKYLADPEYAKQQGIIIKEKDSLFLLKYDKSQLNNNFEELAKYRSIITDSKKLLCYSPSKSIAEDKFINTYNFEDCTFEEFIEGTMINCFYNKSIDTWYLATRSNIGANNRFYADQGSTFGEMFLEAMSTVDLSFQDLNKDYCYSFVLQHPNNRIVVPFKQQRVVLVGVYELTNWDVREIMDDKLQTETLWHRLRPKRYSVTNLHEWYDLKEKYASMNTDYKHLGIIMKHRSGIRSKVRNPVYEKVRKLRGNCPKSQFLYYNLYQEGRVLEYLKYYPEEKKKFWNFRQELEKWTSTLWKLYQKIYIFKVGSLDEVQFQLKPHLYNLHQIYLNETRPKSLTHKTIISYIKKIPPAQLMFAINYPLRQKEVEDIQQDLKAVSQ